MLSATPLFMAKKREERDRIVKLEIAPIISHFAAKVNISMFDCDFTNSDYSDFMIATTESLEDFGYFMGYMRESNVLAAPFFEVKDLVIGVPQNFRGSISVDDVRSGPQVG